MLFQKSREADMFLLKEIKTDFRCSDELCSPEDKAALLDLSETVFNHIIESNCYNDVEELDLTSLTLLIDSGQDTITLVETDTMLPLYPPEKISIWKKILQS